MKTSQSLPNRLLEEGIILKDWIMEMNSKGKYSSDMALMLDVAPATIRGYARAYGIKLKSLPRKWCDGFMVDTRRKQMMRIK